MARSASFRGARAPSLVLLCLLLVAACYSGPDTDHFEGILDDLALPANWQAVKTERHGPGEVANCDPSFATGCPSVRRWYLGAEEASIALEEIRKAMTTAGYETHDILFPKCDRTSGRALRSVFADRGDDSMVASVYRSADAAGLDGPEGELLVVLVEASR